MNNLKMLYVALLELFEKKLEIFKCTIKTYAYTPQYSTMQ